MPRTGVKWTKEAIHRVVTTRECQIVYQPVVDLKTRKVFAFEALARTTAAEFDGPVVL